MHRDALSQANPLEGGMTLANWPELLVSSRSCMPRGDAGHMAGN